MSHSSFTLESDFALASTLCFVVFKKMFSRGDKNAKLASEI